jgi:hypothetical protein
LINGGGFFPQGRFVFDCSSKKSPDNACGGGNCTWTVQVKLTQGTPVDLKFLRKAGARMLGWEIGGNHSLAVGAAAQADFDGGAFR